MRVVPLAPKCGVEVEDVNLAEAEGDTLTAIKQAIYTHGVALFRGQDDFTPEAHIAFAQRWDPRPQHVDPRAAAETRFGGLIASGAHGFALWTRLALEAGACNEPLAIIAGLGSEFSVSAPIRPGDRFDLDVEIVAKRPSKSRPETGLITARHRLSNQTGVVVIENRATSLVECRPPGGSV